ncbi:MAG: hypothetical protein EOO07_13650 [Chitinophagaceae bacterium]|nr:MAG: hypothetical protein EOO07_13650 [Chitinophagaceae bacterium]
MPLAEVKNNPSFSADIKLDAIYAQFKLLISELEKKELKPTVAANINSSIEVINVSPLTGKELIKLIKQQQTLIIKQVEKEHKIVPKNYYRNLWLVLGFTAFGLPVGVAFALSIGNIGLMGVGLPIGMAIGALVGSSMDKKAAAEGRQLDVEIK